MLQANVLSALKSQTVLHVSKITQPNACFAEMDTMLRLTGLVVNVWKDVHSAQALFSVHLLLKVTFPL
jgi:hypothetical protein